MTFCLLCYVMWDSGIKKFDKTALTTYNSKKIQFPDKVKTGGKSNGSYSGKVWNDEEW